MDIFVLSSPKVLQTPSNVEEQEVRAISGHECAATLITEAIILTSVETSYTRYRFKMKPC